MSVTTIEVFECDRKGCGNVHRYGTLPDGWVWAAWRREVPTGNDAQPMVKRASEHHFCGKTCFAGWKKENGIPDRDVQSSLDMVSA